MEETKYSVIVSYEEGQQWVELAESADGAAMRELARLIAAHADPGICTVSLVSETASERLYCRCRERNRCLAG